VKRRGQGQAGSASPSLNPGCTIKGEKKNAVEARLVRYHKRSSPLLCATTCLVRCHMRLLGRGGGEILIKDLNLGVIISRDSLLLAQLQQIKKSPFAGCCDATCDSKKKRVLQSRHAAAPANHKRLFAWSSARLSLLGSVNKNHEVFSSASCSSPGVKPISSLKSRRRRRRGFICYQGGGGERLGGGGGEGWLTIICEQQCASVGKRSNERGEDG
jgi:hypothetical protein